MAASGLGVFNQASWSGVGDVDECWIIATYWALVASGVMRREDLPTIAEFRDAAGRPDLPGPSGGNNHNLMLALKTLIPQADTRLFTGGAASFKKALQSGYIASLSLLSKALPKYLQFGFKGGHQVSVYYQGGKYYVANPLAKEGSALIEVSLAVLLKASGALFGDNKLHAVLIKAPSGGKKTKTIVPDFPKRPRDLAPPVLESNYIDPWKARRFYDERNTRGGASGLDKATDRR
jgi:hypothetical protein